MHNEKYINDDHQLADGPWFGVKDLPQGVGFYVQVNS
jgi:hypothetical protein